VSCVADPDAPSPRALPPELDPRGRAGTGSAAPGGHRRLTLAGRIAAAVVSFVLLAGSGYGWVAYHTFTSNLRHVDAIGTSRDTDGSALNILLVGDDSRPAGASQQVLQELSTQNDGGSVNTDTVMLLHVPADGGQATVVSFPRDSWVEIPGFGKGKLNSAFADGAGNGGGDQGGMKLLIQVVENLSGVHVDHFVKVSLLGFYTIAQALGPIQVCLNEPAKDSYSGIDLPAGVSTLDAKQALSFVRQRHGLPRGDLDRQVRQQYFLSAELRKVVSSGVLLNPGKLGTLLQAVSGALETDPGLDLLDFATQFKDISAGSVRFAPLPITGTPTIRDGAGNDVAIVAVDLAALPAFFTSIVGQPAGYTGASAADPAGVRVRVLNGTGTAGLAASSAAALRKAGFPISGTATASTTTLTTVTYPAGMEAQAKALAAAVPGALVAVSATAAQVTLTLGTDGVRPATPGAAASSAAPSSAAPGSAAPTGSGAAASSGSARSFGATTCIN
jgi:LCP family protein required for cell wall assembly